MDFLVQFQADQMVQNIREAFIENLETVTWMDSITKQAAREKVRRMRTTHAYYIHSRPRITLTLPSSIRKLEELWGRVQGEV